MFTESVGKWTQQGEKLTGSGEVGPGEVGYSVAIQGTTAIVGGFGDSAEVGAAWAFTESAGKWTQQGEKLVADGESGDGELGTSVAVSSEGNTALVGGPLDNAGIGATWVFTLSGSEWVQQGGKLTGGSETGNGEFGWSVGLSSDGNTALVGGPQDNGGVGAMWAFTRSGGKWTQEGEKLAGGGESGNGQFGYSLALSANGDTALVGGFGDNGFAGAAWVFTQSGGKWTQQGSKLMGGTESGNGSFGFSVALSAAGTAALIGGPEDGARAGAVWVFTESGGIWTQEGRKLTRRKRRTEVRLERGAVCGRDDGVGRRPPRQQWIRCRLGVHASPPVNGPSRAKNSPAPERPAPANSARAWCWVRKATPR